jgi:hypothetical protein
MKKYEKAQPIDGDSAHEEYEIQLAIENEYKTYLSYCVEEGSLDPDDAQEIIDKKDWDKVEYMMSYGDYLSVPSIFVRRYTLRDAS